MACADKQVALSSSCFISPARFCFWTHMFVGWFVCLFAYLCDTWKTVIAAVTFRTDQQRFVDQDDWCRTKLGQNQDHSNKNEDESLTVWRNVYALRQRYLPDGSNALRCYNIIKSRSNLSRLLLTFQQHLLPLSKWLSVTILCKNVNVLLFRPPLGSTAKCYILSCDEQWPVDDTSRW